jgi:hypothetical protein
MFYVLCSARQDVQAVIAWGWEDRAFYARWLKMDDPRMVDELQGPVLNLGSPTTENSDAILELAKRYLLTDAAYVERVKRHYTMFRERVEQQKATAGRVKAARRPGGPKGASDTARARARREKRKRRGKK